ncbi:MAG: hypothetical protein GX902_13145 [Lentisphaerae bacterium]|nr:hypothetical protein [Lentisphaerota bacterium]
MQGNADQGRGKITDLSGFMLLRIVHPYINPPFDHPAPPGNAEAVSAAAVNNRAKKQKATESLSVATCNNRPGRQSPYPVE